MYARVRTMSATLRSYVPNSSVQRKATTRKTLTTASGRRASDHPPLALDICVDSSSALFCGRRCLTTLEYKTEPHWKMPTTAKKIQRENHACSGIVRVGDGGGDAMVVAKEGGTKWLTGDLEGGREFTFLMISGLIYGMQSE